MKFGLALLVKLTFVLCGSEFTLNFCALIAYLLWHSIWFCLSFFLARPFLQVFSHIFHLQLKEDVNEVIFALKQETSIADDHFLEACNALTGLLKLEKTALNQRILDAAGKIEQLKWFILSRYFFRVLSGHYSDIETVAQSIDVSKNKEESIKIEYILGSMLLPIYITKSELPNFLVLSSGVGSCG